MTLSLQQRSIPALRGGLAGALLLLAVLGAGFDARAIVVRTISGGPNSVGGISYGNDNGINTFYAVFNGPVGCALDTQGNLYIADRTNQAIRKITEPADDISGTNYNSVTSTYLSLGKSPIAVAIYSNTLYVATYEDSALRSYSIGTSKATLLTSNALPAKPTAVTVARDGSGIVYAALTNGAIVWVGASGSVSNLIGAGTISNASGMAWLPSGWLAVSDARRHVIWRVNILSNGSGGAPAVLAGQLGVSGFQDVASGDPTNALFNQPAGLAAAGDETLVVADKMNARFRVIRHNSVTNLFGVDPSQWQGNGGLTPGWQDSVWGTPEAKLPVSVVISTNGNIFVTELGYHLVRLVTGAGLTSVYPSLAAPSFTPNSGYYVGEMLLTVSNVFGEAYYTTDGSEPSRTNGGRVDLFNGVGVVRWNNLTQDLSALRFKAFFGTNSTVSVPGTTSPVTTPTFSPVTGYSSSPNGIQVTVSNVFGDIWYTTDGTDPAPNHGYPLSMTNGVNWITWTNQDHDLSWLRVRAFSAVTDLNDSRTVSPVVSGVYSPPTTPVFPLCGPVALNQTIFISNQVGEAHYTLDGSDPTLSSPYPSQALRTNGSYAVYAITWTNANVLNMSGLKLRVFMGRSIFTSVIQGASNCALATPVISPTCGYFPNGVSITVAESGGTNVHVYYTTDGSDPTTNSVPVSGGAIPWTNALHDLSWLSVKAFDLFTGASSDTVRGQSCAITTPSYGPTCGLYSNVVVWVTNLVGDVHYTADGSDPQLTNNVVTMTNGIGTILWTNVDRDLSFLRLRTFSGPDNYGPVVGGTGCLPGTPTFGPVSGYFPDGQTILVTNAIGTIFYTTDGTEPTQDSLMAQRLANGVHAIAWADGLHDLSYLRIKPFAGNVSGTMVSGQAGTSNEIGFTHDYFAGSGSTAVIPIVMNLRPNVTVKTILFSVDVTPAGSNTNLISTEMQGRHPRSTDYFQVLKPLASGSNDYQMGVRTSQQANATHLQITVTSPNAGFLAQDHAVPLMVCVPIPVVPSNSAWRLGLSKVSATSDGSAPVSLNVMPDRVLTVSNLSYMVGDISPAAWYSGRGAFGGGGIQSADINILYYVSAWDNASDAVRMPFNDLTNSASPEATRSICDFLDAMDAFPVKKPDGVVGFLDGEIILNRYFGNDTTRWVRTWNTNGTRTTTQLGATQSTARATLAAINTDTALPGAVWTAQARVSSVSQERVAPGDVCYFPVYIDVASGCSLEGLQIHPIIDAQGGAPVVDGVQFYPYTDAEPLVLAGNGNDVIVRYSIVPSPSFSPPDTSSGA